MRVKMEVRGSFKKTLRYYDNAKTISSKFRKVCEKYGEEAINALREATPKDSGKTSTKWSYKVENWGIVIMNSSIHDEVLIALLLQYGHGTKSGTYVEGIDYINPALYPVFNKIQEEWIKEVQNLL